MHTRNEFWRPCWSLPLRIESSNLVESFSGYFGPSTTLDGTALGGSETAFTFPAAFNPSSGTELATGLAVFATIASIQIAGHGTYTASTDVILADPSYLGAGVFGVGLSDSTATAFFGGVFAAAAPAFTVESVVPTTFSGQSLTRLAVNVTLRSSPTFRPLPASQMIVSPGKTTFEKSEFSTFASVTWYGSR
jgi:hypothetical protein